MTSQSTPLYSQLADDLRRRIENGELPPGEQIPSEKDLHETTGYSRSTVRKSLAILVKEGLLTKVHGKGTFVTEASSRPVIRKFLSLTENIARLGQTLTTKVVDIRWIVPTVEQQTFFQLNDSGEPLLEITRLRIVDSLPLCVETDWFTAEFAPLERADLEGSLYQILEQQYQIHPATGKKSFSISYASQQEAFLLDVPRGSALMQIEDFVYGDNGFPLHISRQVLRGDKFKYVVIES